MTIADQDKVLLTGADVAREGLGDWVVLARTLQARFRTGDFATGLALVDRIGAAAEAADHHPDLDLSYPQVEVRLTSHDVGGITRRDLRLAREISAFAAECGAGADPTGLTLVEIGLDTAARDAVKPFWAAVLGYRGDDRDLDELRDPAGSRSTLWFQETTPHEEPRQRFHLDVWVAPEAVGPRIEAALAAGGELVDDAQAPSFVVLADADGNKACLCTWQDRATTG